VDIVLDMGQASISMLQRRMRIGYAMAGRLVDEMARRGIVSEADGAKPRNVLITRDQAEVLFSDTHEQPRKSTRRPKVTPMVQPTAEKPSRSYTKKELYDSMDALLSDSSIPKPANRPVPPQPKPEEVKYPLHDQPNIKGDGYEIWVSSNEINIHKILHGPFGGRIGQSDIRFSAGKIEELVIKLPRLFSKKSYIQFIFEKDVEVINKSGIKDDWMGDAMMTIPYPPESKREFQSFMQRIADDMGIELEIL